MEALKRSLSLLSPMGEHWVPDYPLVKHQYFHLGGSGVNHVFYHIQKYQVSHIVSCMGEQGECNYKLMWGSSLE